ncbi:MAG: hypothetical protein PUC88_05870 [Clostridia bacterium]|nr:hypothetical protein [Clostridia bacterium]
MIYILTVEEPSARFFDCHLRKKRATYIQVDNIKIAYLNVSSKSRRDRRLLKKLIQSGEYLLCSEKDKTLFSEIHFQNDSSNLNKAICVNAFMQFIKNGVIASRTNIALYDKYGKYISVAEQIIRNASCLSVISDRQDLYSQFTKNVYLNYGASIIHNVNPETLSLYNLILSPDKLPRDYIAGDRSIIFTGVANQAYSNATVISDYCVSFPEKYTKLCPNHIDVNQFINALYSHENIKSLGQCIPTAAITATGKIILKNDKEQL